MKLETMNKKLRQMQPPAIAPADDPGYFGLSYNKPKPLVDSSTKYIPKVDVRQEVRTGLRILGMPAAVFLLITFVFREIHSDFQAAAFVITLAAWVGFWLTRFDDDDKYKHKYKDWEYEAIIYKRELAAWQVNKAMMKPKPIDTSWSGMNEEELERLDRVRELLQCEWNDDDYEIPMDFSSSSRW